MIKTFKILITFCITILFLTGCTKEINHDLNINNMFTEKELECKTIIKEDFLSIEELDNYIEITEEEKNILIDGYLNNVKTTITQLSATENRLTYTVKIKKPKLTDALLLLQFKLNVADNLHQNILNYAESPEFYMTWYNLTEEEYNEKLNKHKQEKKDLINNAFSNEYVEMETKELTFVVIYDNKEKEYIITKANTQLEEYKEDEAFYELYLKSIEELKQTIELSDYAIKQDVLMGFN